MRKEGIAISVFPVKCIVNPAKHEEITHAKRRLVSSRSTLVSLLFGFFNINLFNMDNIHLLELVE
jgi:hypothetical protein